MPSFNEFVNTTICLGENIIQNSESQNLLGVIVDKNLTFNMHVSKLCDNASKKFYAFARVCSFMDLRKRKLLMKSFCSSQFGYCPLVWMNHNRTLNNRINRLHERALRIVYNDYISPFKTLLDEDKSVTIHQRNFQALAIEMYKVKNSLSPEIMNEVFQLTDPAYILRNNSEFRSKNAKTVTYGTETVSILGPKIWNPLYHKKLKLVNL